MPTLLTEAPEMPPVAGPPRKRWTRSECTAFESSGVFEREPLELINGELISKMGKDRPHVNSLTLLLFWLVEVFCKEFVNAEAPIDVSPEDNPSNEPQPDLIVLNRDSVTFVSANPKAEDIRLLVEISDTLLSLHLTVKAALYGRAQIAEYWVLDLASRRLFVHRNPVAGGYTSVLVYSEHEEVSPLAARDAAFVPAQAFPERLLYTCRRS